MHTQHSVTVIKLLHAKHFCLWVVLYALTTIGMLASDSMCFVHELSPWAAVGYKGSLCDA